jgi:hypothetical protein
LMMLLPLGKKRSAECSVLRHFQEVGTVSTRTLTASEVKEPVTKEFLGFVTELLRSLSITVLVKM